MRYTSCSCHLCHPRSSDEWTLMPFSMPGWCCHRRQRLSLSGNTSTGTQKDTHCFCKEPLYCAVSDIVRHRGTEGHTLPSAKAQVQTWNLYCTGFDIVCGQKRTHSTFASMTPLEKKSWMDPVKCLAQAILACFLFFTTVRQITCAWQNAAHHAEVGKMWLIFKRIIQIPMKLKKVTRPLEY